MPDSFVSPSATPTALPDEAFFRRRLRGGTLGVALTFGLPAAILLAMVLYLMRTAERLEHTDEVLAELHEVEARAVNMETGLRGFQVTGDERFLRPFAAARDRIEARLDVLAGRVAGNPGQVATVAGLRGEVLGWIAFADEMLTLARRDAGAAREAELNLRGKMRMDVVRARVAEMVRLERDLRTQRNETRRVMRAIIFAGLALMALAGTPAMGLWLRRFFRDVSGSYQASLAAAERRAKELQVTLRSIGDAVVATNARGEVVFLNPVAERLMGWTSAEAHGRALVEVFAIFNETTGATAENPVARVLREKVVVGLANHTVLRARDGRETAIEDSAAPILGDDGEVHGVILVFHDAGEKRAGERALLESEARLSFLNRLGDATRTISDPPEILATVAELLGKHLRVSRCAYAEVAADGDAFTILHDFTDGCASTVGTYELSLFGSRAEADMHAGRTLVVGDVDVDLTPADGADTFNAIGIKALVCCPLVKEGALRAMMAVHQTSARAWTRAEISLVEEVVERCWAIIERARAEAAVREGARLAVLRAEFATVLASGAALDRVLQRCCESLVRHLDAAFARVWTMNSAERMLELRASAGLYTHLDGPHARVPVGECKIGRIAQRKEPHLTNDVPHDPNISASEWARREGMQAFAGYPLVVEGRVLGVIAMFSRKTLSPAILGDLAPMADTLAQCLERRHAAAALASSEAQLRQLADAMPQIVWMARPDGFLDYYNRRWYEFTGRVQGEGGDESWMPILHPDDVRPCLDRWYACVRTGEDYDIRYRFRDEANGGFRWFLGRALPVRDESGEIVRWFGTCTDIDALVRAEEEAQSSRGEAERARAVAEAASKAKDDFLAALSHELRTPLTPVLMIAATLRQDDRLPPDVREQLSMVERNVTLEARLIDDLLDLTRIAKGKLSLRLQACDAHSLIGLAVEIVRDDAQEKGIVMKREFGALRSGLMADPARFQQVIWNLLRNAVKFTPRNGQIEIRTLDATGENGAARLHIEVSDSGIGIAPDAIDTIFLPFEQAGLVNDHRFGGMGLGLAIARAIVDLHGGTIAAKSAGPGRGATFIVELPGATEPPSGVTGATELSSHPLLPGSSLHDPSRVTPMRLLLVEDHEPTLQVLSRLLTRAGHFVQTAGTVDDALKLAAAEKFDAVISDLGLPDGTGTDLMRELHNCYGLRGIALSGYGMEDDLARSREAGFALHLVKPVDFHQLEYALRELGVGADSAV